MSEDYPLHVQVRLLEEDYKQLCRFTRDMNELFVRLFDMTEADIVNKQELIEIALEGMAICAEYLETEGE